MRGNESNILKTRHVEVWVSIFNQSEVQLIFCKKKQLIDISNPAYKN